MNINSRSKGGEKYKDHPSIKMINENVSFESCFSFKETRESGIEKEISDLNSKKAETFWKYSYEDTWGFFKYLVLNTSSTAWKVSKYVVFSGPYFPVFSPNTGKYGPETTPYLDTFHAVKILGKQYFP